MDMLGKDHGHDFSANKDKVRKDCIFEPKVDIEFTHVISNSETIHYNIISKPQILNPPNDHTPSSHPHPPKYHVPD
jgi:hypothetical protein